MHPFEYANPKTLKEAVGSLGASWNDAAVLAGGTDLISLMKDQVVSPKRVVNIKNIAELGGVQVRGKDLRIGATATFDELSQSSALRPFGSLLAAVRGVTSPQIRNMGTAGGDLCQRPRCWYFRQGYGLFGTKDGQNLVTGGENKYHAIFGDGPAHFVSASSLGPALIALGARVRVQGPNGPREIPVEKFFVVPADADAREIALAPNEILTEILLPLAPATQNFTYEVRQKEALDWPLAAASVAVRTSGSTISGARVVLGHVAPTPWVASEAEKSLVGQPLNEATAAKAGEAAVSGAKPLSGNGYKVQLTKVAVKRALLAAFHPQAASSTAA
jgi:xanthine dehydrogenase YagS FAD-binding subunit